MRSGLWKHPDFRKFWAGQTAAYFGGAFGTLAFPLTAVLVLNATPAQMGALLALQFAPGLLFGFLAGVWVDRVPRRRVMLAANWLTAAVLLTIPTAAALHWLTLAQLYVCAFLVGTSVTFFMVAFTAYLPTLVSPPDLVDANSKLESSRALARLVGPGLAGVLVQVITAPVAIGLEAVGYIFANGTLLSINAKEQRSAPSDRPVWREAIEGLQFLVAHSLIRPIVFAIAILNTGVFMASALVVIYATRNLYVRPAELGVIFAAGGVAAVIGTQVSRPLAARFGLGTVISIAPFLFIAGLLLTPAAGGPHWLVLRILALAQGLTNLGSMVFNINQASLRQIATPGHLQGRVQAAVLVLVWSGQLAGALLGGSLAQMIGLRPTLFAAVGLSALGLIALLPSDVRRLKEQPVDLGFEAPPSASA